MFAGLGIAMILLANYGLFAWQMSLGRIELLGTGGILLIALQYLRIELGTPEPTESKGGIDGFYGKAKEVQASLMLMHRHIRRLLQRAMRNGETNI